MQIGKSKSPLRTEIIQAMQSWEARKAPLTSLNAKRTKSSFRIDLDLARSRPFDGEARVPIWPGIAAMIVRFMHMP